MKRVLVLTASFGEGHNTAARAIREALEATGEAEVRVGDLYADAIPLVNSTVKFSYSFAINRLPCSGGSFFSGSTAQDGWRARCGRPARCARSLTTPSRISGPTCLFDLPLYAYLYRQIQKRRLGVHMPIHTVITDSVGVNSAWHRCLSDSFLVADTETEQLLVSRGVPQEIIHPIGFPVSRYFAGCHPLTAETGAPWKLLFMPSTQIALTLKQVRALLELPNIELTVVAGRHARIFDAVESSGCSRMAAARSLAGPAKCHACFASTTSSSARPAARSCRRPSRRSVRFS